MVEITSLTGTAAGEKIMGTGADERIWGLGGNDNLNGGGGTDYIAGGDGKDIINGGSGHNFLMGGGGSDAFIFNKKDMLNTTQDSAVQSVIYDFQGAGGWNPGDNDFIAFVGFGAGSYLELASDSTVGTGLSYYNIVDGVTGDEFLIAVHNANESFTHLIKGDFNFYA